MTSEDPSAKEAVIPTHEESEEETRRLRGVLEKDPTFGPVMERAFTIAAGMKDEALRLFCQENLLDILTMSLNLTGKLNPTTEPDLKAARRYLGPFIENSDSVADAYSTRDVGSNPEDKALLKEFFSVIEQAIA